MKVRLKSDLIADNERLTTAFDEIVDLMLANGILEPCKCGGIQRPEPIKNIGAE